MNTVNIRESLRNIDADSCCKYDLLTMYDACPLTDEDKAEIAKLLFDNEDAEVIYQKLCNYFCDDDVSDLTGITEVQSITPLQAIVSSVKNALIDKYDLVQYNDVAGQFEIISGGNTYTFGISPTEDLDYASDTLSFYIDYNYDSPVTYSSIKEASDDLIQKCCQKVSQFAEMPLESDDFMEYTVYDVVEDEGRLCAKCMNESTNSFEDIKLGKVNSDAVNELLNNILNNPNYKLTNDCRNKIAENSAPWGIVMSPGFDITATNALMSSGDFSAVSFGESSELVFEQGDRVTDGNRKGTVLDCDAIKVLVDWDYSDTDDIEWVTKEDLSFVNSLKESTEEEVEIENPEQEFSSAATSINSTKLPAIYNMVNFNPGDVVVDFGGGKFDNAVNYLKDKDVTLLVYDPYNRSAEHNKEVLKVLKEHGGADAAVNSNVLNVIKEPRAREAVLRNIKKITKRGAPIYITVYEGKGDGAEGPTKSGYQLNRKTADYMDEITQIFNNVKRKGKLITAINESQDKLNEKYEDPSTIGYGLSAPVMTSMNDFVNDIEKWFRRYQDEKVDRKEARNAVEILHGQVDSAVTYMRDKKLEIDAFDKYWAAHKAAMIKDMNSANDVLASIGVPEIFDTLDESLTEAVSGDEMVHEMRDAVSDISGIQDISEGRKPDTYLVTFDSEGPTVPRARILLKAFMKAELPLELDSTNGSSVFIFNVEQPVDVHPEWEFIKSKGVRDSDGFFTSYEWYRNKQTGLNIFMFGIDSPDPDYADWETESDSEAEDWFNDYTGFEDDELEESVSSTATAKAISKELKDAAYKLFKTPRWGFETDKEIKDYINPFFEVSEDPKTGDLEIEVRAELEYENLTDLANVLNKVVETYDSEAYFEPEQPGILCAVIREED